MTQSDPSMQRYLQPTLFIDSHHPEIEQFAAGIVKNEMTAKEKAIKLYYAVRDEIKYDPYNIQLSQAFLCASATLQRKKGFCVAKAILYAALLRGQNIPSRLGFADVRNHLTTPQLRAIMQTDVFVYHGYTELFLNHKWIKATPVFNIGLCVKTGIKAMAFDGENDCIFHPFDCEGHKHMEYLKDHGTYADLPLARMTDALKRAYPLMAEQYLHQLQGDFEQEAVATPGDRNPGSD